ncbi:MAG: tetratricopeptide repeat protein, partial [Gemmataceae bacterium]
EKPADTMALLKQAREGFDKARKFFKDLPALELECMVSGGRASEALEEVDDARKRYQEVIDSPRFKESAVAREVRQRMKEMDEKGRWKTVTQIESNLRKTGP